jgi:hypothetical protein
MSWRGLIGLLLAVLVLGAARRWLDVVEVRGSSMAPTLLPGDRLIVIRASPRAGDVVLARDPGDAERELVKRVARIGPAGIRLHGDNPLASTDARAFGALAPALVAWRAVLRYWPLDRAGPIAAAPVEEGGESASAVPEGLVAGA